MEELSIVPWNSVDAYGMHEMIQEYSAYSEACKPLDFLGAPDTNLYGVICAGRIIGVLRYSYNLYRECHGMIGISIRPCERNRGYGTDLLCKIKKQAAKHGKVLTACIDINNKSSISAFQKAGWGETGRKFEWKGSRTAVEYST